MKPSPTRVASRFAARMDTYKTKGGREFKMSLQDFSRFLRDRLGVSPGPQMGRYLRDEELVDDKWVKVLSQEGAKVKRIQKTPAQRAQEEEERWQRSMARKEKMWDDLVDAIYDSLKGYGSDLGDYYLNMPQSFGDSIDDLPSYIETVSGDLSQDWEYALESSKAAKAYSRFKKLHNGRLPREKKWALREIYAEAWHTAMMEGYKKLRRDQKEIARLDAMRQKNKW